MTKLENDKSSESDSAKSFSDFEISNNGKTKQSAAEDYIDKTFNELTTMNRSMTEARKGLFILRYN